MKMLGIISIKDENPHVKTFYFAHQLNSKPGQFIMLWIPGIDQKPLSISYDDGTKFGLTVLKRGPFTNKLFEMRISDRVGITRPYGTSFTIKPGLHYILVAGGCGAAPLAFLADALVSPSARIDFLIGAKNAENLLFEERLSKIPNLKLHIATDDGSKGYKGYVTDLLQKIISEIRDKKSVVVATCGPEQMQKKVLDICNEFDMQCEVSIERYMKCGFGICGQCVVDDLGICMCTHGPVVSRELANKIFEFGKYHRDKTGAVVSFRTE